MSHWVYQLIDYRGFCFYVGYTKNLEIRIKEHERNKNSTSKKTYRVRRSIKEFGFLKYKTEEFSDKGKALEREKELIAKFKGQLVNVLHGKHKRKQKQVRSKGRSKQCPTCLNYYKRLGAHKCKKK